MPTIEKLAENFVKAASELIEATGGKTYLDVSGFEAAKAHLTETMFDNIFGTVGIEIKARDRNKYPIEKSITVGGVKFFCVTDDMDTWAKLKGYVRKEGA